MPQLIHQRKKEWVQQFKPKQLKGRALNPNAATEDRYFQALKKMIEQMARETLSEVAKLYKAPVAEEYFTSDASISAQAKILTKSLADKFSQIFGMASRPLAETMTRQESKNSAAALKESLKQLSGGLTLKTDVVSGDIAEVLKATVAENVALIKSIPSQYFTQIEGAVMRSITTGRGLQDLVPFIQKHKGIAINRARIIARDQTRKAFSNLNFARMDKIGIQEYEWLHSAGGQHPRKLHQRMSGKIYRIDQPPIIDEKTGQRGKPGDLINCRCRAIPVVKFNEE